MGLIIISILQTAISAGALVFMGIQIVFLSKQLKNASLEINKTKKWNIMDTTFKYFTDYQPLLNNINIELLDKLEIIKSSRLNFDIEDFKKILINKKNRKDIFTIMEFYERLSLGIKVEYIDEEIAKNFFKENLISTYKNLEPYILLRRNETNNNYICEHLEEVAKKWIKEEK